ncbi:MAG: M48 family metalloprotease [Kastovskya adunca ATA6-11-RM4]|jgi:predicted Zn-dependent protease|nr:M48 family metalloprotease [Kastovskya adunca ATA6-11-RM4]
MKLNFLSSFNRSRRSWLYPLLSVMMAILIVVSAPQASYARSWLDLIFRGVQIIQLSNVGDRQEVQIGQQINQQLVSNRVRLYRNPEINRYVNNIGQQLAKQSSRPNIPYTFQVVADDSINAFATMGGFVYVNTGLMAAADNEAQLASVMAHEIGHITERHALKQARQSAVASGVAAAAGLDRNTLVQIGVDLALRRPNSREDELEADREGLKMLRGAGYAPSAMVEFMEKLLQKRSVPTFLSTHPATSDRIGTLQRQIPSTEANTGDGLDEAAYKRQIRPVL